MKSYMAKTKELEKKWYVIDAEDKVLGRLSTEVSKILMGKHKPTYTPHIDTGDFVIIINAEKIKLTGNKINQLKHTYHTLHPGGLKEVPYSKLIETKPEKIIELAVKGMLPKNKIGKQMIRKLKVYGGSEHNHDAQMPEVLEI